MKLAYTHPSSVIVAQARAAVERAGIDCVIRNEYAAGAIGELAPIDAWPELWVVKDRDLERARTAIERARQDDSENDWDCPGCGSQNPPSFDWCWHCARDRFKRVDSSPGR